MTTKSMSASAVRSARSHPSSLSSLAATYGGSDEDDDDSGSPARDNASAAVDRLPDELMMKPITGSSSVLAIVPSMVNCAPAVMSKAEVGGINSVDPNAKELVDYNPKYEELFKPVTGPSNPFKSESQKFKKNTLTGFVEQAHVSDFHFANEISTFDTHGYARDPSAGVVGEKFVGDTKTAREDSGASVFESKKTGLQKRKWDREWDSGDVEGYTGPWGGFKDEQRVSKPNPEMQKELDEIIRKRKLKSWRGRKQLAEETTAEDEKATIHLEETTNYMGRSFMQPPQDTGVNLRADAFPEKCYIPKKQIHTYRSHNKAVNAIRWFPNSAHMLMSCSMDNKIKLWEVYGKRRLIITYAGHKMPVRDITFNNSGTEFLSASFDKFIKLWDTETGQIKQRFTTGNVPVCLKYHPDDDKQNFFLSGMHNKKVIQWDTRTAEVVQEYDRHLGPVNSITFFDKNRRFCTTSDDKSIRIWEWEIPVDTKLIQTVGLHSIPTVTKSPDERWIVGQAMDNRIVLFQLFDEKLRFAKKKAFKGHTVAGYACTVDFSPDMGYIISGDSDGKLFIWDWRNHRVMARWKAHDNICIGALWHPHEKSKIATCGWDGVIKLWE